MSESSLPGNSEAAEDSRWSFHPASAGAPLKLKQHGESRLGT